MTCCLFLTVEIFWKYNVHALFCILSIMELSYVTWVFCAYRKFACYTHLTCFICQQQKYLCDFITVLYKAILWPLLSDTTRGQQYIILHSHLLTHSVRSLHLYDNLPFMFLFLTAGSVFHISIFIILQSQCPLCFASYSLAWESPSNR